MSGRSELKVELVSVTTGGQTYQLQTSYHEQAGASRGTRTAETVGGGAVLGALIGAIAGRGKGAGIGTVVGAGTGTAVEAGTHGQQVKIPSETKLEFTLKSPVTITVNQAP
jgi:outer membrane lipoprotein SlyB